MARLPVDVRDPLDRRLPRIAPPCGLVIFGVTGDLARTKLLPAVYDLANRGLLNPAFALTGFARRDWGPEDFESYVRDAIEKGTRTGFDERTWEQLRAGLRFVSGTFDDPDAYEALARTVADLDRSRGTGGNHAFYLSIPPSWFPVVCQRLADTGLNRRRGREWRRVIIEKPFGHDLASARELSDVVSRVFDESDVFRIDHYLGKETVQNIMAMRFANTMFEPLWKANYVDHVQITMAEDIGIGTRAGYYDGIGAARDVIQNHLLQLLALTAMEEPVRFDQEQMRAEKEKVLSAVRLPDDLASSTARGQYSRGVQGGGPVKGFLDEDGIGADSTTETFAAITLFVDTRRWAGVPFYLRAGKRLGKRVTEIAVVFKKSAHVPFDNSDVAESGQNVLVIRVQPDEGMTIKFGAKVPGTEMQVRDVTMDFGYGHAFTEDSPEAYERLILDALAGAAPLFPHQREVELSWRILDPVLDFWASQGAPDPYRPGSWGPASAHEMMARDGRAWRLP
ncbi:glucose-6-phosphate dehydrogenase [Actinomyces sp. B33]|uniref:glucose-6-phosphate dehydrogenase n=1 Tax=Actinomyces sp. B33 TaxID=2942131 RepID=UPI002341762B|nr:glucose-6-phosphate dehydrogenase [Actinomyces sp. B33]MDC4233288.1 glucose-6-phosphate dehydrogenase [Actinomyces sp. B33]